MRYSLEVMTQGVKMKEQSLKKNIKRRIAAITALILAGIFLLSQIIYIRSYAAGADASQTDNAQQINDSVSDIDVQDIAAGETSAGSQSAGTEESQSMNQSEQSAQDTSEDASSQAGVTYLDTDTPDDQNIIDENSMQTEEGSVSRSDENQRNEQSSDESESSAEVWNLDSARQGGDSSVNFIAKIPRSGVVKYEVFCVNGEDIGEPTLTLTVADNSIYADSSGNNSPKGGLTIGPKRKVADLSGAEQMVMFCYYVQNGSSATEFNASLDIGSKMKEVLIVRSEVPSNYEQLPKDYRTSVLEVIGYGFAAGTSILDPRELLYAAKHDAVHEEAPDIVYEPPAEDSSPIPLIIVGIIISASVAIAYSILKDKKEKKMLDEKEMARRDKKISEANKKAKAIREKRIAKDLERMIEKVDYSDNERTPVVGMMLDKNVRNKIKIREIEKKKKQEEVLKKKKEREEKRVIPSFVKKKEDERYVPKNSESVSIDGKKIAPWAVQPEFLKQVDGPVLSAADKTATQNTDRTEKNEKAAPSWMKQSKEEKTENVFF